MNSSSIILRDIFGQAFCASSFCIPSIHILIKFTVHMKPEHSSAWQAVDLGKVANDVKLMQQVQSYIKDLQTRKWEDCYSIWSFTNFS